LKVDYVIKVSLIRRVGGWEQELLSVGGPGFNDLETAAKEFDTAVKGAFEPALDSIKRWWDLDRLAIPTLLQANLRTQFPAGEDGYDE